MALERVVWTDGERELWSRIALHDFERPGETLTFTGRLARDHGWDQDFARGAVKEYRRFCFLTATVCQPMTPSEEVDEVWHLHLTFSRDYWDLWCGKALRAALHHQPTTGGAAEGAKFAEQYAQMLARYEAYFGTPDAVYWPGTVRRFGAHPRFATVDLETVLVVRVPPPLARFVRRVARLGTIAGLAGSLPTRPASAAGLGVLDWDGPSFLQFYFLAALAALAIAVVCRSIIKDRGSSDGKAGRLSTIDLALLSGGAARAADVLALELVRTGHLIVRGNGMLEAQAGEGVPAPQFEPLFNRGPVARSRLVDIMQPWIAPAWERLARAGLAISPETIHRIRITTGCIVVLVLGLGLLKIMVGLSRDKPVGFLVGLVIVTAFCGLALASVHGLATGAGDRALLDQEKDHARLLRAPLADEAILAFALLGAAGLAGTPMASYAAVVKNDSGGAGGCGGGGGGGCGGCSG